MRDESLPPKALAESPSAQRTERAQEFRTPREAEAGRPRLETSCSIPLEAFAGLIAKYSFAEVDWQRCQLEELGSICRQEHGRGWIAKRKDGKEGYIGRNCAHDHFGADLNFAAETSRINRELRVDALVSRLNALLNKPDLTQRLVAAIEWQDTLLEKIVQRRQLWPAQLLSRLQDMAKTGNREIRVEVCYVEYDKEKKRNVYTWQSVAVSAVSGLDGLDSLHARQIGLRLEKASEAKSSAVATQEQSEKSMRAWADALDDIGRCETELQAIESAYEAFAKPENLKWQWLLVRRQAEQIEIVQCVLELASGRPVADSTAAETRKVWEQEIRAANNGRDFRCI